MTKTSCESVYDLLVEYADGELPDREVALVETHLRDCIACRSELSRLRRSLEHVRAIWQESAGLEPVLEKSRTPRARRKLAVAALAGAAAVLVLAIAANWFRHSVRPSAPAEMARSQSSGTDQRLSPAEPGVELQRIELSIAREARAARLGASSELLADQPALASYFIDADAYLAMAYEESSAGKEAKRRLLDSNSSSPTGPKL
jgi:anti-sigma factor RsiW